MDQIGSTKAVKVIKMLTFWKDTNNIALLYENTSNVHTVTLQYSDACISSNNSAFDWIQQESNDFAAVFTLWSAL